MNLLEHLVQDKSLNNLDLCGCKKQPKWLPILTSISHFLLTFNSSANFVIYYSTERNFKRVLNNMMNNFKCFKNITIGEKFSRSETSDLRSRSVILEMQDLGATART